MKKNALLILICLLIISGCASITAYTVPNSDLKKLGSMYVVNFPKDSRHLEGIIANELTSRGYQVIYGEEKDVPASVNILVTYIDHWTWDMSTYMKDITIELRNKNDKSLIASGKSFRPSLQRRSPKTMIKETLDKLLK